MELLKELSKMTQLKYFAWWLDYNSNYLLDDNNW